MTPDTDNRLVKIAYDFYSFVRIQAHFEDDGIESKTPMSIIDHLPSDKYYDSYHDAAEQMQRYSGLCEELMALPLTAAADRLLSAAMTLSNIADLYYNYGRYDDAMELLERVKAIREKVLGQEHPDTAATYNSIAEVYNCLGDYPKALEWHEKALNIKEKALGKEHLGTATTYNNIAVVYKNQGDFLKALEWYVKSYRVIRRLGDMHPNTVLVKNNMETAYQATNLPEPFETYLATLLGDIDQPEES